MQQNETINDPVKKEKEREMLTFRLVPCQGLSVGWVERSETQHDTLNQYMLGFAPLNPTYEEDLTQH